MPGRFWRFRHKRCRGGRGGRDGLSRDGPPRLRPRRPPLVPGEPHPPGRPLLCEPGSEPDTDRGLGEPLLVSRDRRMRGMDDVAVGNAAPRAVEAQLPAEDVRRPRPFRHGGIEPPPRLIERQARDLVGDRDDGHGLVGDPAGDKWPPRRGNARGPGGEKGVAELASPPMVAAISGPCGSRESRTVRDSIS